MDNNEKLGLIERVNHASEDQAKRTLRSMILKCTVTQPTIARAIRDAIERHTPTPMIVYQQPESEDDDEAALVSSHKKSTKKKDQDGSGQEEDEFPSTISKERRSTRRGDINSDPLVGQLILKKTKTKTKGIKKRSSDHDEEKNNPNSPKKNRSRHASKLRAEPEQRTCDNSMGEPSHKKIPTVIDLVTSSDDDTSGSEHSENESLDDKSSHDDGSDNDSPDNDSSDDYDSSDDDSSNDDSSDDEVSQNERQDGIHPGGSQPSQDLSNNKANQASMKSGDGSRGAAHSITVSMAKASNQNNGHEMSPLGSGRKRKAPERTVEEFHNDQPAQSATNSHANKRTKQSHLYEPQRAPEDRQCDNCELILPSVAQLLKHRLYCEGAAATLGNHRSEPPSGEGYRQIKQLQKASKPAGDSFTDEPRFTLQLPSRPRQRTPSDRGLSVPPPSFVHEPNNFPRGPTPTPLALARSDSGIQSSPPGLVYHPAAKPTSYVSPDQQSKSPEPESLEHPFQTFPGNSLHRCIFCKQQFRSCENSKAACSRHHGMYLSPSYLLSSDKWLARINLTCALFCRSIPASDGGTAEPKLFQRRHCSRTALRSLDLLPPTGKRRTAL